MVHCSPSINFLFSFAPALVFPKVRPKHRSYLCKMFNSQLDHCTNYEENLVKLLDHCTNYEENLVKLLDNYTISGWVPPITPSRGRYDIIHHNMSILLFRRSLGLVYRSTGPVNIITRVKNWTRVKISTGIVSQSSSQ